MYNFFNFFSIPQKTWKRSFQFKFEINFLTLLFWFKFDTWCHHQWKTGSIYVVHYVNINKLYKCFHLRPNNTTCLTNLLFCLPPHKICTISTSIVIPLLRFLLLYITYDVLIPYLDYLSLLYSKTKLITYLIFIIIIIFTLINIREWQQHISWFQTF